VVSGGGDGRECVVRRGGGRCKGSGRFEFLVEESRERPYCQALGFGWSIGEE
jgi:hypothetical protein